MLSGTFNNKMIKFYGDINTIKERYLIKKESRKDIF